MAFNPLKNRKPVEPDLEEQPNTSNILNTTKQVDDELLNYDSSPVAPTLETPMVFEGTKVSDLQEVGLETISLLKVASKTAVNKQSFNLNLLKTLPLSLVFDHFKAVKEDEHTYKVLTHTIIVDQSGTKWFNKTSIPKRGNENAINLTKHLLAIQENLNEVDNAKSLFVAAGRLLTDIHNQLHYQPDEAPAPPILEQQPVNNTSTEVVSETIEGNQETQEVTNPNNAAPEKELTLAEKQAEWAKKKERDKAVSDELKEIPLQEVFDLIEANDNEDGDSNKWKTSNGHNIGAKGQLWQNYSTLSKGYGAITLLADFIAERDNINVREDAARIAVWHEARGILLEKFGQDLEQDAYKGHIGNKTFSEPFYMPHVLDHKLDDMRDYLHEKRGLPKWIIEKQIKENLLFAGAPSSWKSIPFLNQPEKMTNEFVWAVFMSPNGEAAELRGIAREDKDAKIKPKGNVTDRGGFRIKPEKDCNEKVLMSVEAAVDTLSYAALYPGRGAASCMGVNYKLAVMTALQTLQYPSWKYEISLDNDQAGYEATLKFKEALIDELSELGEDGEDGEEVHRKLFDTGRLKYFSLGIKCAIECFANNKVFYLDVSSNETGKQVATLFQQQLSKVIPMNEIRGYIKQGLIKYANICPVWERTKDPEEAAKLAFDLLSSDKPYYYRAKSIKKESEDMTPKKEKEIQELTECREIFEKTLKQLAGEKYKEWVAEGKIIFKKEAIAKDWNDFLNYSKNKPEVAAALAANETKYGEIYKKAVTTPVSKKMKLK